MASLSSSNPHADSDPNRGLDTLSSSASVPAIWKACYGAAVADDSKHLLAVTLGHSTYIMADVRFLRVDASNPRNLVLEMFFDGECDELNSQNESGYDDFLRQLQSTIQTTVQVYFERRLKAAINESSKMLEFKSLVFPDVVILPAEDSLESSFRDAGCMLSFIAVRISMPIECSSAVGAIVFPEMFGMRSDFVEKSEPIPKWIMGMGAATIIVGIGTIYAWAQILLNGNPVS